MPLKMVQIHKTNFKCWRYETTETFIYSQLEHKLAQHFGSQSSTSTQNSTYNPGVIFLGIAKELKNMSTQKPVHGC